MILDICKLLCNPQCNYFQTRTFTEGDFSCNIYNLKRRRKSQETKKNDAAPVTLPAFKSRTEKEISLKVTQLGTTNVAGKIRCE